MILPASARTVIVRKEDAIALGYCMTAIRPFCRANDINFRSFIEHGIEADRLLGFNDQYAIDMVEQAMRRTEVDRG